MAENQSTTKKNPILSSDELTSWLKHLNAKGNQQKILRLYGKSEEQITELAEKYPSFIKLEVDYNPTMQQKLSRSGLTIAEISLNKKIPTLALVSNTYGERSAIHWLKVQFASLNDYAEQGKGMTNLQLEEMCSLILGEYYWMNLAEICMFIAWFKLGRYGQFYGAIGPMKITSAMIEFVRDRRIGIEQHEYEQYKEQRRIEIEERKGNAVSYTEYLDLKKRAENGDEEAKRIINQNIKE